MDALLDHANGLLAVGYDSATAEACRADMRAIRSALDEMGQVCAEAYQVVGVLLNDLGIFETERADKILDNLSEARLVHQDVLPWASGVELVGAVAPIKQTTFPSSPAHRALSAFISAMLNNKIGAEDMRAAMIWHLGLEEAAQQKDPT